MFTKLFIYLVLGTKLTLTSGQIIYLKFSYLYIYTKVYELKF